MLVRIKHRTGNRSQFRNFFPGTHRGRFGGKTNEDAAPAGICEGCYVLCKLAFGVHTSIKPIGLALCVKKLALDLADQPVEVTDVNDVLYVVQNQSHSCMTPWGPSARQRPRVFVKYSTITFTSASDACAPRATMPCTMAFHSF